MRKVYYNLTVTSLSMLIALLVRVIVLAQLASAELRVRDGVLGWVAGMDPQVVGFAIAGLFVAVWGSSAVNWKVG